MQYFRALATDYDGTIAHDGVVDEATIMALDRLKRAGRRLIMVTGRELPDLQRVCPRLDLFDRVVVENGALLYNPATKEERPLGPPPPPAFVDRLQSLGLQPLSIGQVIVATWEPNETAVLEAIRDLGLDLQIIFNKGAVMVLPNGINKASGLGAALEDMGLSAHNVVATGDAENDLAFMRTCGCAVAVGNALPAVKEAADMVTDAPRGAGVAELIDRWIDREGELLDAAIYRHSVLIGATLGLGQEVSLRPDRGSVLITGTSGGGKSTLATALLERLAEADFQLCLFDPEGDYDNFAPTVTFGDANTPVAPEAVLDAVRKLGTNVTANLLGSSVEDRPEVLANLLPAVLDIRARYGRPHWILIDEAHHMLPRGQDAGAGINLDAQVPTIFITVHPDTLAAAALRSVGTVLIIGRNSLGLIESLSQEFGRPCPVLPERGPEVGEAVFWACRTNEPPVLIRTEKPKGAVKRHTRKYAQGTLGPDRSFYFKGPEDRLDIRAHNLSMFLDIGDGVDAETYLFHLRNGDVDTWLRTSIKDEELADEIANIAANESIDVAESRKMVRAAVEQRYTAPATPD
ncbi:HAD hydrolase family protein [Lichenifustis flavocetrariae]|uniref:HAD hydrolase family protein n=1 Tax=Lichenifustis flavocetrariae TaxID=2949735 RepID=A0AA41YVR5_9HYPH|nr:HAD hydrolase family protein [Lichenifustis flavocetrariae]MCW6508111.1 HAD hydrolase family protein [Lichenifustis flavocetrariae]